MRTATDLKACFILESLQHRIAEGEVEYLSFRGMHRFSVHRNRTTYHVGVHEKVLDGFGVEDLKRFLKWLSEEIHLESPPRQVIIAYA